MWSIVEERPGQDFRDISRSWWGILVARHIMGLHGDGVRGEHLASAVLDWIAEHPAMPYDEVRLNDGTQTVTLRRIAGVAAAIGIVGAIRRWG